MTAAVADDTDLNDLLGDEAINRPERYYARLRAIHPVLWNPRWKGWIVTGYDAVSAGYRDAARLSSDRFSGPFGAELRNAATSSQQLIGFLSKFFVWKDPPYHTRARALVNRAFVPRSVESMRPRIRSLVRELAEPLADGAPVDFLSRFAFTLPVVVISEFLGVGHDAREDLRRWSEDLGAVIFVRGHDDDKLARGEAGMKNLVDLLRPIVRERIASPREDVLSALAQPNEAGERLSEDEVIANAALMVFAGHETTMNLLANGIVAFHRFPGEWQRLRENPELARTATEEMLRFDGPIRGLGRWAKTPLELAGQPIAEGDRVLLVQHAANRDPAAFEQPDRFDITRSPNRHLAFGQGIHTCLGAPLARLEVHEALTHLAAQFRAIEVVTPTLEYNETMVSRSLKQLEVRFHAA
jgi:cytochrome P450